MPMCADACDAFDACDAGDLKQQCESAREPVQTSANPNDGMTRVSAAALSLVVCGILLEWIISIPVVVVLTE